MTGTERVRFEMAKGDLAVLVGVLQGHHDYLTGIMRRTESHLRDTGQKVASDYGEYLDLLRRSNSIERTRQAALAAVDAP